MNIVILRGTLSSDPVHRDLASGTPLVQYEVTTRSGEGPAASVPVAWFDPPKGASTLSAGTEVVVTGQVRRRFFRTAVGGAAARVDVEAVFIGRAGQRRQLDAALRRTQETLDLLLA